MDDELEIGARNLMLCREVTFDARDPVAPYSLHHMLSTIRAVDPDSIKLSKPIYTYVEYFGHPGEYEVWIDVVFLGHDEKMELIEEDVATFGPFDLNLSGDGFVEGRFYCLRHVPFLRQGIYEIHLKLAGVFEPVISQRIYVEA